MKRILLGLLLVLSILTSVHAQQVAVATRNYGTGKVTVSGMMYVTNDSYSTTSLYASSGAVAMLKNIVSYTAGKTSGKIAIINPSGVTSSSTAFANALTPGGWVINNFTSTSALSSLATLNTYDLVVIGCTGSGNNSYDDATFNTNIQSFVSGGKGLFVTGWVYYQTNYNSNFQNMLSAISPFGGTPTYSYTSGYNQVLAATSHPILNGISSVSVNNEFGSFPYTVSLNANSTIISTYTTYTAFTPATGLEFGSTNSHVSVPDNNNGSLNFGSGDFTVEVWTKKNAGSSNYGNSGVVGKWNTGGRPGTNEWLLNNSSNGNDNVPSFLIETNNGMYTVNGNTPMTLGTWYHIAAVRSGDALKLYVNGVLQNTTVLASGSVITDRNMPMYMGAFRFNSAGEGIIYSNIGMDELRIWKRALCTEEINNSLNCELNTSNNALSALYHFNQGNVNTSNAGVTQLNDASANANNGTLFNFALSGTSSNWAAGKATGTCNAFNAPVPVISGTTTVYTGGAASSLTANISGGTWSSSNTNIATVNAGGVVTGTGAGTSTITYVTPCGGSSSVTVTAVKLTGPTGINNGILMWLDASDVDGDGNTANDPAGNTSLDTWKDRSGLAKNATKIAGQNNITYLTNQINGKSVVRFARVNDNVGSALEALGVDIRATSNPKVTIFTVYKSGTHDNSGQGQAIWGNDDGAWDRFVYNSWAGTDDGITSLGPVGQNFISIPGAGTPGAVRLHTGVYDHGTTNSSAIYFNGAVAVNFTDLTNLTAAKTNLKIGLDGDNGAYNGDIAEMIVYNRKLTDCEILEINKYLGAKYGVTFTSATISSAAAGFCPGGSVVLNASAGSIFQWNKDGAAIEGATASSYTATTAGSYTVDITSASGCTATSSAKIITINALPAVTASSNSPVNSGSALNLTAGGAVNYSWTGPASFVANTANANLATAFAPAAGTYTVTGTDANGCKATATTDVVINAAAGALNFDRTKSNKITVQNNINVPTGNSNYTIEAWIKPTTNNTGAHAIAGWGNWGTANQTNAFRLNGTSTLINYWWGNDLVVSVPNLADGNWHHVVASFDGVTRKIYTDGILRGSDKPTGHNVPANSVVTIGSANPTYSTGENFDGSMDEVRIWNRALCIEEIQAAMNCERVGAQTGLAVYYKLNKGFINADNTTVTNAYQIGDFSGNGNLGVLSSDFTLTGTASNWVEGKVTGTCAAYTSSEINIKSNNLSIVTGDLTPSTADNTDFGETLPNQTVTKTFTVENQGTLPLTVTSITKGGTAAANYTVSGITFPLTIAANSSANFSVNFISASVITANATITVNSDDCDEAAYSFAVTGKVSCVAPSFINTNAYVQGGTSNADCTASITYALSATGTPSPAFSYVFTGATVGSGIGTGSGQTFNKGVTRVTVTASNACGTPSTSFDVTVVDNVKPIAVAKHITLPLNSAGTATLTPAMLDNGSSDNCGPVSLSISSEGILCGIAGENGTITITAPLGAVIDRVDFASYGTPTGECGSFATGWCHATNSKSIVEGYALNKNSFTIAATNGVFGDPCGGTVKNLRIQVHYKIAAASTSSFNCSNVGTNNVTLTVTDGAGNVSTADAVVTVVDNIAPVAVAQNLIVTLNASGAATVAASSVNNGSTDACGGLTYSLSKTSFDCSNVGDNAVVLTVTDKNGNASTANAVITVRDLTAPSVVVKNATVFLNASGVAMINVSDVVTSASDACGEVTYALSRSTFNCTNRGNNTVTITVTDKNNNSTVRNVTVTVVDNTAPTALTQNIEVVLNAAGFASVTPASVDNNSFDNCGIVSRVLDKSTFNCSNLGDNTITLTVRDAAGNTSSATAIVKVIDNTAPILTLNNNIVLGLNANGTTTLAVGVLLNSMDEACPVTFELSKSTFDCSNLGDNQVTLTATDRSGNATSVTTTVKVIDPIAPTVKTKSITVYLNANGVAEIVPADVDGGTFDNCSFTLSLSKTTFGCSNTGANTVILTATDTYGNRTSAPVVVTVADNIAPNAITKNITVALNANGQATIMPADVDNNSNDACGVTLAIDKSSFDCSNVGRNTVTLTVTDASGNASTATALVTIIDNIAPNAITKNITVALDANGNASITPASIDNGSNDACGVTLAIDKSSFNCSNVGANTVILTVTDANGNVASAPATVTVIDNIAPVVKTKNISVYLSNGTYTVTAAEIDNGSADACGIQTMTVSPNTFVCGQFGTHTVTLTVTDKNGNVASSTATVTVLGNTPVVSIAVSRTDNTFTGLNANTIALGYGAQKLNLSATNSNTGTTTYSWSPATALSSATVANPVFTPTAAGTYTYTVTATNQWGCFSTKTVTLSVMDVRCGNNGDKVIVCQVPPGNPANPQTICISPNAVATHLAKGSYLGNCRVPAAITRGAETLPTQTTSSSLLKDELTVNEGKFNITATPNPTSGLFTARLNNAAKGKARVEVIGMNGNVVEVRNAEVSNAVTQITFDLSGKAQGMYQVRAIASNGKQTVTTVLIQR